MTYISYENIKNSRTYIATKVRKPETFTGLILFLMSVSEQSFGDRYLKSNMSLFSKYVDNAFYLANDFNQYSQTEKYWFALLGGDWLEQVKTTFLYGSKISSLHFSVSLFWYMNFESNSQIISELKNKLPSYIFQSLFDDDASTANILTEPNACTRSEFLAKSNGTLGMPTIKFDGTFIKKRASDLSAAPFSQTLYAANEIKKIVSVFDFDFLSNFDLGLSKGSSKIIDNEKSFFLWLVKSGLSEKTSNSYSGTSIKFCNKILSEANYKIHDLYKSTSDEVKDAFAFMKTNDAWAEADNRGNRMYSSAIHKYLEFLNHKGSKETVLHKSLILLAGISGTGKTRFIREQAEQSGSLSETYQLVPVRPDWHEPSDLLGYVSRLNGKPEYVATDVLKFVVKAWQAILKAGFDFDGNKITGNKNSLASVAPYWLCLDEMNLAPVEQYFADYLSVIETRKWKHYADDVEYTCDALLSKDTIKDVADSLRAVLDLNGTENDALWSHFTAFGISLPFNLIVAGTVNMDETTHGFSRKVLDRALSFDFGEFFPNNFDTFFEPDTQNFTLSYPIWSDGRNTDALSTTFDSDGRKSVAFLKAVNTALDNTPFKLAFRALNELLLAVICSQPQTEQALMAVWDDFVMCKVLPRIEGDYDKLALNSDTNGEQRTVLPELKEVLAEQMASIWDGEQRPDLYRENTTPDATGSKTILIACRSNKKLGWMEQRLSGAGFTSFWP